MRRIIVGAQVSMDGVMQAPGGAWEDPTKGFKFGGWAMPSFDQEFGEGIDRLFNEKANCRHFTGARESSQSSRDGRPRDSMVRLRCTGLSGGETNCNALVPIVSKTICRAPST